ncbi:hypothetical protein SNEBB_004353 [Seison nebaliae]|nr:hypothetical protein SNEBB_004353 [Seison nebaliae]
MDGRSDDEFNEQRCNYFRKIVHESSLILIPTIVAPDSAVPNAVVRKRVDYAKRRKDEYTERFKKILQLKDEHRIELETVPASINVANQDVEFSLEPPAEKDNEKKKTKDDELEDDTDKLINLTQKLVNTPFEKKLVMEHLYWFMDDLASRQKDYHNLLLKNFKLKKKVKPMSTELSERLENCDLKRLTQFYKKTLSETFPMQILDMKQDREEIVTELRDYFFRNIGRKVFHEFMNAKHEIQKQQILKTIANTLGFSDTLKQIPTPEKIRLLYIRTIKKYFENFPVNSLETLYKELVCLAYLPDINISSLKVEELTNILIELLSRLIDEMGISYFTAEVTNKFSTKEGKGVSKYFDILARWMSSNLMFLPPGALDYTSVTDLKRNTKIIRELTELNEKDNDTLHYRRQALYINLLEYVGKGRSFRSFTNDIYCAKSSNVFIEYPLPEFKDVKNKVILAVEMMEVKKGINKETIADQLLKSDSVHQESYYDLFAAVDTGYRKKIKDANRTSRFSSGTNCPVKNLSPEIDKELNDTLFGELGVSDRIKINTSLEKIERSKSGSSPLEKYRQHEQPFQYLWPKNATIEQHDHLLYSAACGGRREDIMKSIILMLILNETRSIISELDNDTLQELVYYIVEEVDIDKKSNSSETCDREQLHQTLGMWILSEMENNKFEFSEQGKLDFLERMKDLSASRMKPLYASIENAHNVIQSNLEIILKNAFGSNLISYDSCVEYYEKVNEENLMNLGGVSEITQSEAPFPPWQMVCGVTALEILTMMKTSLKWDESTIKQFIEILQHADIMPSIITCVIPNELLFEISLTSFTNAIVVRPNCFVFLRDFFFVYRAFPPMVDLFETMRTMLSENTLGYIWPYFQEPTQVIDVLKLKS